MNRAAPRDGKADGGPVLVASADADFARLLLFLLHHHGFQADITVAAPALLLLHLTEHDGASPAPGSSPVPCIVLTRPELLASARARVPQALAYLPLPLVPHELVALVRQYLTPA